MKIRMKSTIIFFLLILILGPILPKLVSAETFLDFESSDNIIAEDISGMPLLSAFSGFDNPYPLFDGRTTWGTERACNVSLTLDYEPGIGSVYLIFGPDVHSYNVIDNSTGASVVCGQYGFMHEYLDFQALFGTSLASVTIEFGENEVSINELFIYTPGEVPATVQKWNPPAEDSTDMILFTTHGDDEQLFFSGLLPYYAGERDYRVQVVYFTDHRTSNTNRQYEMLDGLWTVGVTTYPVFGEYTDFRIDSKEKTYEELEKDGFTKEHMLRFVVEQIRRFKPLVVVAHDFDGEYGHPQHMIYAELVAEAIEISNSTSFFPDLAERYGLWEVPKAYFHLYEYNKIVMDWDQPLECFDGLTAYEVTRLLGFPCHASQISEYGWYHKGCDKAADIEKYSPCEYGLYRSTVGPDILKNDMFENVLSYAQQEKKAEEDRLAELERQEAERKAAEEAAQQEAERKAAEEAARQEAERKAAEEARLAEEARAEEQTRSRIIRIVLICVGIGSIVLIALAVLFAPRRHGHYEKRNKEK